MIVYGSLSPHYIAIVILTMCFDAVTAALCIHQNISKSDVDYCVLEHANIAIPSVVTGKIGSIHIHMTV